MSTKTIQLSDLSKEIKNYTSFSLAEQKKAITSGLLRSIPDLVAASPVDTGLYAQSWDFQLDEESAILGNFAPHAPIIEYGARPFTPPLAPLLAWAKRVLQDSSQPPEYSPRVQALARGTQKKIALVGLKPHFILRDMMPKIIENIKKEFEAL